MHSSLLKFILVPNSALPFWRMLVFESLHGISQSCLCSMSVPQVKIVPQLDVHQLLILFVGTSTLSQNCSS
jgi:hypothetical protein